MIFKMMFYQKTYFIFSFLYFGKYKTTNRFMHLFSEIIFFIHRSLFILFIFFQLQSFTHPILTLYPFI
ncbi:uncharacterized protein BYT42DRAFT_551335 [Radiomyces spectabilis]|uniref:uncharacterized protein n=1 Tax=Radiomyces spectabilis TaxID=64574 RepID=UPI00221EA6FA|nr:uncharacterized protein BYT42DRAFT_551335 [Radiomyces spectabilis]KAI8393520.1 hypothetical protein BYT42DRAFT_551335 [Radiomyces spectabilis]